MNFKNWLTVDEVLAKSLTPHFFEIQRMYTLEELSLQ